MNIDDFKLIVDNLTDFFRREESRHSRNGPIRQATPQKGSKKRGRPWTKAPHNEARARMRRKLAKASRRINRG